MPNEQRHEPLKLDTAQRANILRRALAAWFKAGGTETPEGASGVKMRFGLAFPVLHCSTGVLAVYRVRPDNLALRVMKRWPTSLEKVTPPGSVGNDTGNEVI
jgi:hypothetical protein